MVKLHEKRHAKESQTSIRSRDLTLRRQRHEHQVALKQLVFSNAWMQQLYSQESNTTLFKATTASVLDATPQSSDKEQDKSWEELEDAIAPPPQDTIDLESALIALETSMIETATQTPELDPEVVQYASNESPSDYTPGDLGFEETFQQFRERREGIVGEAIDNAARAMDEATRNLISDSEITRMYRNS